MVGTVKLTGYLGWLLNLTIFIIDFFGNLNLFFNFYVRIVKRLLNVSNASSASDRSWAGIPKIAVHV